MTATPDTATPTPGATQPTAPLAPILRATLGEGPTLTLDLIVSTIRAAADNAKHVMPPIAAAFFRDKLTEIAVTAEGGGNIAWFVVNQWLDQIDEINQQAADLMPSIAEVNAAIREVSSQLDEAKSDMARLRRNPPRLKWHHGPTASDPDPGKIWHADCGGELLSIDGGLICDCGAQEQGREACELPPDWRTQVTSVASWTADEVLALVEEWQAGE